MDVDDIVAKREAVKCARQILEGSLSPYEGARRIWMDVDPQFTDRGLARKLSGFIGEATEWEDNPEARDEIEEAIRQKAADLVTEWGEDLG
ncbi:MAG TPA: hypothetical protein VGL18_06420 [Actinomycetota bacterium]|jgi:hypothetical protein